MIFTEQYQIIKNNNPHVPFGSNLEIAKENTIRLLSSKIN